MRRVRQRAEDVEHGADAELFTDGADVFHGCVIFLCEHKAEADLFQFLDAFFGRLVDIDAEGLETVRRAAF